MEDFSCLQAVDKIAAQELISSVPDLVFGHLKIKPLSKVKVFYTFVFAPWFEQL